MEAVELKQHHASASDTAGRRSTDEAPAHISNAGEAATVMDGTAAMNSHAHPPSTLSSHLELPTHQSADSSDEIHALGAPQPLLERPSSLLRMLKRQIDTLRLDQYIYFPYLIDLNIKSLEDELMKLHEASLAAGSSLGEGDAKIMDDLLHKYSKLLRVIICRLRFTKVSQISESNSRSQLLAEYLIG